MYITLSFNWGDKIQNAIKESIKFCKKNDISAELHFNDIELFVNKDSKEENLYLQYKEKLQG